MKDKFKISSLFSLRSLVSLVFLLVLMSANLNAQKKIGLPEKGSPKNDLTAGYSLIDGDIQMPTAFVESVLHGQKQTAPNAAYQTNLWATIVPYEFDANVTSANQTNMINAMAVLENVAQVVFVQCQPNCQVNNYVHVQDSTANNSAVGMVGGRQIINIVSWNSQFRIVHELMHCLGIFHEQSRPDRNNFITTNCNNVQGGCNGTIFNTNFTIQSNASSYGVYDFDSVMHYGECDFSIDCSAGNGCACTNKVITVLPPNQGWQTLIGQRDHLSAIDQTIVMGLYPANNWAFLDAGYNGANGAPNGTLFRPYATFFDAYLNIPAGGTIWVTTATSVPAFGTFNKSLTIKAVRGVTLVRIGN